MNTHKKNIFSGLVMVVVFLIPLSVAAQSQNDSVTLTLPQLAVPPATTGTFGLSAANAQPVAGAQIRFTYNATIGFQVTGATITSRTQGFELVFHKNEANPTGVEILILLYSLSGAIISPSSGVVVELQYQTLPDASGTTDLVLTEAILGDEVARPFAVALQNGNVVIVPTVGDVSLDKTQAFTDRGGNSVYWGDTISYAIAITNFFEQAVHLMIQEALSGYTEYLLGTLTGDVSGATVAVDNSLPTGIPWEYTLDQGKTLTLAFDVEVGRDAQIGSLIENMATISYLDPITQILVEKSDAVQVRVGAIPEPTTFFLFGIGVLGLLMLMFRKRDRKR